MGGAAGGDGDAHSVELAAGLGGFGGVGEARDEGAQFSDAGLALAGLEEGLALVQVRDGALGIVGELLEDAVVVLDGGGVLAGAVVDLAQIVERVAGQGVGGAGADLAWAAPALQVGVGAFASRVARSARG